MAFELFESKGISVLGNSLEPAPGTVVVYPPWYSDTVLVKKWDQTFIEPAASTTAGIQEAIDALPDEGGLVVLPVGTYLISSRININKANVTLTGSGLGTIIQSSAAISSYGLIDIQKSNVCVENMKLISPAATPADDLISANATAAADTTNWVFRNLELNQYGASTSNTPRFGIHYQNAGFSFSRHTFENLRILFLLATAPTAGDGINLGAGSTTNSKLWMRNVEIDGFHDGLDTGGGGTGSWNKLQISDCLFANCEAHGARFYHAGELQITNCEFDANDVGAWFDNGSAGSGQSETIVNGCKFVNNLVVGAFTEEWIDGSFVNCTFKGNRYGLWLSASDGGSVLNCTTTENTIWGLNTDKDAGPLTASGRGSYDISHTGSVRNVKIDGCTIKANGEDGAIVHSERVLSVTNCHLIDNGTSGSGAPASSGFAELRVQQADTGADTHHAFIEGNVIGKVTEGSPDPGGCQYGVEAVSGGITLLMIKGNEFISVEDAIEAGTVVDIEITGNTFYNCEDITLSGSNTEVFRGNTILLGSLVGSVWDGLEQVDDGGKINFDKEIFIQGTTVGDYSGSGTPEGAVTAAIGSTFRRSDGGASTSFYIKESGAGNTGWVAK